MNKAPEKFRRWPYAALLASRQSSHNELEHSELIQDRRKLGNHLCRAILRGDNLAAGHLLKSGAPVNHQEFPDGWTPLIYSIYYNNPAGRRLLLANGADISVTDFSGRTVLMFAALNGDAVLAGQLLQMGASVSTMDKLGRTALDFAKSCRSTECIKLLEK